MTLQYTEHPTPKIDLVVDAPKRYLLTRNQYEQAFSKCERIEVVNGIEFFKATVYDGYILRYVDTGGNHTNVEKTKDGDAFEIDDEKVSVEIGSAKSCREVCSHICAIGGCEIKKNKIATLKLKETDYNERYNTVSKSDWFNKAYKNKSVGELKETVKEVRSGMHLEYNQAIEDVKVVLNKVLPVGAYSVVLNNEINKLKK